ncbi:hypothetical protein NBRC116586_31090 [Pseudooceanicola nitratireducens]
MSRPLFDHANKFSCIAEELIVGNIHSNNLRIWINRLPPPSAIGVTDIVAPTKNWESRYDLNG